MNLPVLNLTLVFTDLAGSTALFEEHGDAAALATISACQQIMRRVIVQHGGKVVKTLGDGVMAVFSDAATALQAAWLMVQVVAENPSNPALRAGVHYGEVLTAEEDYFGDTVNVAARLLSEAKPGQVVTSLQTVLVLPETLQSALHDLGVCQVRGRAASLNLYAFDPSAHATEGFPPSAPKQDGADQLTRTIPPNLVYEDICANKPSLYLVWQEFNKLVLDSKYPIVCLGADSSNEVFLSGASISPTHARIEWQEEAYVLVDQSNAGTWVQQNGQAPLFLRHEQIPLQGTGWISLGSPFVSPLPNLPNEANSLASSSLVHFYHLIPS